MWFEHLIAQFLNRVTRPQRSSAPCGLMIGFSTEPPHRPVVIPDGQRCEHAVCIGKTGAGKTYLLERLALEVAKRGEGLAFFDFHGDASMSLLGRLLPLDGAVGKLVVLDPSHPTRSPAINVLAAGASEAERFRKVSELSSILRQRWGVDGFGARTEELLRNSLYTLASSGSTLADLSRLLTDDAYRQALARSLDHPDVRAYWSERYDPLSDGMKGAFREPLLNKVTAFLIEPAARHLLAQTDSTIDIDQVMASRQWLILRLPKGRLREHAHTLGNLLFAQLQFAAFARERLPRSQRHTFTIICDEVQNLAENDLAALITEGRKFGIAIITANQFWEQLPRELRGCLLSAASHICFRVSSADAQVLASELSIERRSRLTVDLTTLDRGEGVARIGSAGVARFRVPKLPASEPLTSDALDALIEPVTHPRELIEQSIRDRRQAPAPEPVVADMASTSPTGEEGHHDW